MTSDQIKAMKRYDLSSYMEENCDGDGFNVECMDESDTGEYVKYADVLSLLARIEALEQDAMAKNHITLMRDRDMYRWRYEAELSRSNALKLSNNALRGAITKLKKKLAAKEQP